MVRIALYFVLASLGMMAWQWLERERQIASGWRKLRASVDLETSRALIDRCYDLLVTQYGLDTFEAAQLGPIAPSSARGIGVYEELATLAGTRWEVTLPPLSFRLLPARHDGIAGTYSLAFECSASLTRLGTPHAALEWTQVQEIGIASEVLSDAEALPIVLAHEISHLVLHRDQVTTGNESDDEILTDVATALVGYGELMRSLKSRTRRLNLPGRRVGWSISGPGYLQAEEVEYLLARHAERLTAMHSTT